MVSKSISYRVIVASLLMVLVTSAACFFPGDYGTFASVIFHPIVRVGELSPIGGKLSQIGGGGRKTQNDGGLIMIIPVSAT